MSYLKEYVRDKNGNRVGKLFAFKHSTNKLGISCCFCDTRYDKFNDEVSAKTFNGNFSKIPFSHKEQFNKFLIRCKRYFKNDVIYPDWFTEHFKEQSKTVIKFTEFPLNNVHKFFIDWAKCIRLDNEPKDNHIFPKSICNPKLNEIDLTHRASLDKKEPKPFVTIIYVQYDATYENKTETTIATLDYIPNADIWVIDDKKCKVVKTVKHFDLKTKEEYYSIYVELIK